MLELWRVGPQQKKLSKGADWGWSYIQTKDFREGQTIKLPRAGSSGQQPVPKARWPVLVSAFSGENGMVAEGKVKGINIKFLVHTGSAITLISKKMYDHVSKQTTRNLIAVPFEVWLADGKDLEVSGITTIEICLGNIEVMHKVVIADIKAEGILGMDFLGEHDCVLNISKSEMKLKGQRVPITIKGFVAAACCRIASLKKEVIPPGEKLIAARVIANGPVTGTYMTEAAWALRERDYWLQGL